MKSRPYKITKSSYFSTRPLYFKPGENFSEMISLRNYCKKRSISTKQARKFINKKWLAISAFNNQIYVEEICPDEISNFLQISL
jgi:hypothetical protein